MSITTRDLSSELEDVVDRMLRYQLEVYLKYNKTTKLSTANGLSDFVKHLESTYNFSLTSVGMGSLVIKGQCLDLHSLESLWNDYHHGLLNEAAEKLLVTDDIKREINLETVKLKTIIEVDNYLIGQKALTERSGVAGINDTSSQTAYPGQLEDTGWSDKSSGVAKDKKLPLTHTERTERARASRGPLHKAAISGQYETVKMLLESGDDVNQRDQFSLTPLHLACWYGQESIVKLLLKHGANVNAKDRFQRTPMQKAERQNHQYIVQLLLENDARPSLHQPLSLKSLAAKAFLLKDTQRGFNMFTAAVVEGNYNVVFQAHVLLSNFETEMGILEVFDILEILETKEIGHQKIFRYCGEEVEKFSTLTELHRCKRGNDSEKAVELVLNDGLDVNSPAFCNRTALLLASPSSSVEFIETLIDLGANVNAQRTDDKVTPLSLATHWYNYMAVRLLLERGADANIADADGLIPLHDAASKGFYDISRLLIKGGSNVNLRSKKGRTPLYLAVQNSHERLIKLLLESKADVCMEYNDDTAERIFLVRANVRGRAAWGYVLLKKHLLGLFVKKSNEGSLDVEDFGIVFSYGWGNDPPDVNTDPIFKEICAMDGETSGGNLLHVASRNNSAVAIDLLIKYGTLDLNLRDAAGFTPLHIAAIHGNMQAVEKLVDLGADTSQAEAVANLAHTNEEYEIEEYLESFLEQNEREQSEETVELDVRTSRVYFFRVARRKSRKMAQAAVKSIRPSLVKKSPTEEQLQVSSSPKSQGKEADLDARVKISTASGKAAATLAQLDESAIEEHVGSKVNSLQISKENEPFPGVNIKLSKPGGRGASELAYLGEESKIEQHPKSKMSLKRSNEKKAYPGSAAMKAASSLRRVVSSITQTLRVLNV